MSNGPASPGSSTPSRSDIVSRRHEFILQYYDMATKDLERHLGIGWQTIAVIASAIISLSLGQKGELPIPIAVSAALAISFWGVLNIFDSNFWALRAIAFLANVEAIYFYEGDQKIFNPYAGKHPPFKMLNSLKYQLYVAISFIIISLFFFALKIWERTSGSTLLDKLQGASSMTAILWSLPLFFLVFGLLIMAKTHRSRTTEYLTFVRDCPGPGMLKDRTFVRDVDLSPSPSSNLLVSGDDLQQSTKNQLLAIENNWKKWWPWVVGLCLLLVLVLLIGIVAKIWLFQKSSL